MESAGHESTGQGVWVSAHASLVAMAMHCTIRGVWRTLLIHQYHSKKVIRSAAHTLHTCAKRPCVPPQGGHIDNAVVQLQAVANSFSPRYVCACCLYLHVLYCLFYIVPLQDVLLSLQAIMECLQGEDSTAAARLGLWPDPYMHLFAGLCQCKSLCPTISIKNTVEAIKASYIRW